MQSILIVGIIIFSGFALGELGGTLFGGWLAGAPKKVRTYTAGGLIPQGGIVIGLALLIKQDLPDEAFSNIIINVVIGATVLHELIGPVITKLALDRAGETIGARDCATQEEP